MSCKLTLSSRDRGYLSRMPSGQYRDKPFDGATTASLDLFSFLLDDWIWDLPSSSRKQSYFVSPWPVEDQRKFSQYLGQSGSSWCAGGNTPERRRGLPEAREEAADLGSAAGWFPDGPNHGRQVIRRRVVLPEAHSELEVGGLVVIVAPSPGGARPASSSEAREAY